MYTLLLINGHYHVISNKQPKPGAIFYNSRSTKIGSISNHLDGLYEMIGSTDVYRDIPFIRRDQILRLIDQDSLASVRKVVGADDRFSEKDLNNVMFGYELGAAKRPSDIEHLNFIYARMAHIHGENENYDYMLRFKKIIDAMTGIKKEKWEVTLEMKQILEDQLEGREFVLRPAEKVVNIDKEGYINILTLK